MITSMNRRFVALSAAFACLFSNKLCSAVDGGQIVVADMIHLRSGDEREWDTFPAVAESRELIRSFTLELNDDRSWTLELVHEDIKQVWEVSINGVRLARLRIDENPMRVFYPLSPGMVKGGENTIRIACVAGATGPSDDIRVGRIVLHRESPERTLGRSDLTIVVRDMTTRRSLPARLTIVDRGGILQETSASSNDHLAVRPGIIYTSTGSAAFSLPEGDYTIYAGRGFEYSLAKKDLSLAAGDSVKVELTLERQVSTEGLVACDPHVHTLTHSGHGDATIQERMITLAAEGIELPVATDHNVLVDYRPTADTMRLREYFTPVIGDEVTTAAGHFNAFPFPRDSAVPDHQARDWGTIVEGIFSTRGAQVAILNHARDIHRGFRPFDPARHYSLVGENVDGWPIEFNGMEVINSSATQTNIRTLFEDWLGLLNRGYRITPVGSSDSHDVGRHFVGQGRTYIRCDDSNVGQIDTDAAIDSFRQGRVGVSYGLLVQAQLEQKFGAGEVASVPSGPIEIECTVQAPDWINPTGVEVYVNARRVREETITASDRRGNPTGVAWRGNWTLDRPRHDVCLVVMALGAGIESSYWRTAKPYQPISTSWESHVFGCTGVFWVDVDADGVWTSAHEYSRSVIQLAAGDPVRLLRLLANYDEAVSLHTAHALHHPDFAQLAAGIESQLTEAAPHVRRAMEMYEVAWRATERARIDAPASNQ